MTDSLVVEQLSVRYGAIEALTDVSIEVGPGARVGLIGPNGAGKTTLLNAISGFTRVTAGRVLVGSMDVTNRSAQNRVRRGIVRSFQTVRLLEEETVRTNVAVGCERAPQPGVAGQLLASPFQRRARRRDVAAVDKILDVLGLSGVADRPVNQLPFASRRLTELGRILVVAPQFLLLDEPAAGFDQAERRALADRLRDLQRSRGFALVVVEHDIEVVRYLCDEAIALDSGRVIAVGTPNEVLNTEVVQTAYFGSGRLDA